MAKSHDRPLATTLVLVLLATAAAVDAFLFPSPAPASTLAERVARDDFTRYFDVQAHRGGRGNVVESILPTFAFGLASGATTIELDIVLSEDDEVMVWHDEQICPTKCIDTSPAFAGDPKYPYVGRYVANLTSAQLKTLDCGSLRLPDFPLQLSYPGSKIPTLAEFFAFLDCATPDPILLNVETKTVPPFPNTTRSARDTLLAALPHFARSGRLPQTVLQSFDWAVLRESKRLVPDLSTAALADDTTIWLDSAGRTGRSTWLGGLSLDDFEGPTEGEKLVSAAASINASIFSPSSERASSPPSPSDPAFVEFATAEMIRRANDLGMAVKVWTVNDLSRVEELFARGVQGILTDYPGIVRSWVEHTAKRPVAPLGDAPRIERCLSEHNRYVGPVASNLTGLFVEQVPL